ncbi:MAG: 30S ribosomal protein S21 [Patescibacteria group bacterium]
MAIVVKKREGESDSALIYRFVKKIKRSGILKEAKHRRFKDRPVSRIKKRLSALHREVKKKEMERAKKLGIS